MLLCFLVRHRDILRTQEGDRMSLIQWGPVSLGGRGFPRKLTRRGLTDEIILID